MLSNLWKALWGSKSSSTEQTRQAIERDAQRLSQFQWVPEHHATLRPPTQEQREHNVTPVYGSRHSFSVVQSRPLSTIYQDDALNERNQATVRSLPRVRSRQDEEDNVSQRRKRRRAGRKQQRQQNSDIISIPSSSSAASASASEAPPQQQRHQTDDNTMDASSSSSSYPQQPTIISRAPVSYPERPILHLHPQNVFTTNDETELKHIIQDMLRPGVWNTLNGDIVQQWLEVPYVIPGIEDLLGRFNVLSRNRMDHSNTLYRQKRPVDAIDTGESNRRGYCS